MDDSVSSGRDNQDIASSPLLSQFTRRSLGEEATRYLRDALLSGRYQPGQRMAAHPLANALHISAMPVREALVTLANEGLLTATPRRGFQVAHTNMRDIDDVFRVHAFVAGLLAQEAALLSSETLIDHLSGLQNEIERTCMDEKDDSQRAVLIEQYNFAFHRAINRVPDASRLRWFLRASTRYVPRHFYQHIPGWLQATRDDHPRIIEALRRHDAAETKRLIENHTLRAGKLVADHLERMNAQSRLPTVDQSEDHPSS